MSNKSLRDIFMEVDNFSGKLDSYFEVYEKLFDGFKNKKALIVEIGVLDGGSLQMWKKYFGPSSRIIGIDKNPDVLSLNNMGFETYVADQENEKSLLNIFNKLGPIDILIDDGAHTTKGQIVTCLSAIDFMNEGGLIVVEDTHSSFVKSFGGLYRYSFASWVSRISNNLDTQYLVTRKINFPSRFLVKSFKTKKFINKISSVIKFRSITVFTISQNIEYPNILTNKVIGNNNKDYRWTSNRFISSIKFAEDFTNWNYMSIGNTRSSLKKINSFTTGKKKTFIKILMKPFNVAFALIGTIYMQIQQISQKKYF